MRAKEWGGTSGLPRAQFAAEGKSTKLPYFFARSWLNDDVTRPSEIVRSSGWGCNTFACVQQAVRHRINDSRPFAASSKQLFRTHLAARKRHYGACRWAVRR